MEALGRSLVVMGLLVALLGGLLLLVRRLPFLGHLPGDIVFQRDGFSFYFPLATMLVISLVLTVVATIVIRLLQR